MRNNENANMRSAIIKTLITISMVIFGFLCYFVPAFIYYGCDISDIAPHCFGLFLITPRSIEVEIFNFTTFISALALLAVLYSVSNYRYRFRITTAPIPLKKLSFYIMVLIGFGTLISEYWFSTKTPTLACFSNQLAWQSFFAVLFLLTITFWFFFAFINPPTFGKTNYKPFFDQLLHAIIEGNQNNLDILAEEIWRSVHPLVKHYDMLSKKGHRSASEELVYDYCNDLLLLFGNRLLCKSICSRSPATAMEVFNAIKEYPSACARLFQFTRNISIEALKNTNSILYHEDSGFQSGLIGYWKPFTKSLYGDWNLLESLDREQGSPLDIGYETLYALSIKQYKKYCDLVKTSFESSIKAHNGRFYCRAIRSGFYNINSCLSETYKIDHSYSEIHNNKYYEKLNTAVYFYKDCIGLMNDNNTHYSQLQISKNGYRHRDYHEYIANMMFKIIYEGSTVRDSRWTWTIHHNIIWSAFFEHSDGPAWKVVRHKLRRLIYNEISKMRNYPNYKNAKILSLCMNVMGFDTRRNLPGQGFNRGWKALHQPILNIVRDNFLRWRSEYSDVTKECLVGTISYDLESHRLVKTYAKRLSGDSHKEYLELAEHRSQSTNS